MFLNATLWGNTYYQYLILLISIILSIAIGKAFYWLSSKFIKIFTAKTKTKLDDILIDLLEKPVVFLIILAGVYYGLNQLTLSARAHGTINNILLVLLTLNISWVVINLIDSFILHYVKPMVEKTKSELDNQLIPIIRKLIKIILWVIVIVMLIKNFGYDVSALLTGIGLGGLAFALAAKDLLSNLFGGIAILTDKPFKIGDRIKVENNDGWVTEIGLRTTRIKTLDGTQLVIPNSKIAHTVLENVSREKARKVKLNLGVEYSTSQKKMLEAQKILKDIVKKNKSTDNECVVSFTKFGDSALNILIIYWIKDLSKILNTKNEINLEVKQRFEKAGISMAFPTRTIHLFEEKKKK